LSEAGRQPMSNDARTIWTSFNGEIYNFQEIRQDLQSRGIAFSTHTDTEVLLKAYERWGIECIRRFRGMFAFALWDGRARKLFLVRDRMGVKPLYYWISGNAIGFASELKALVSSPTFERRLNATAAYYYLRFGYVPSPQTIYTGTFKVRPGHYVE